MIPLDAEIYRVARTQAMLYIALNTGPADRPGRWRPDRTAFFCLARSYGRGATSDITRLRLRAVEAVWQAKLPLCRRVAPRTVLLSLLAPGWAAQEAVCQTRTR